MSEISVELIEKWAKYKEEINEFVRFCELDDETTVKVIGSSATYLHNLSRNILHYATETYDFKGIEDDLDEMIKVMKSISVLLRIVTNKAKRNMNYEDNGEGRPGLAEHDEVLSESM